MTEVIVEWKPKWATKWLQHTLPNQYTTSGGILNMKPRIGEVCFLSKLETVEGMVSHTDHDDCDGSGDEEWVIDG